MKGIALEWQALPKRRCDNCPNLYRPGRPVREGERGFCCGNCRKEFHKHGGSFSKLKPVIVQEVRRRIKELGPIDSNRLEAIDKRITELERVIDRLRDAVSPGRPM